MSLVDFEVGVARTTYYYKAVTFANNTLFPQDPTTTQPIGALGLTYKVAKDWALRGEFETRRVKLGADKENVNTFSVGMQYSF